MKKFALSLIIAAAALFGMGTAASAQYGDTTVPTTTVEEAQPTVAPTTDAPDQGGSLPTTGSSGMSTTTGIAIGLLGVGVGLFVVTRVRRQSPAPA